MRSTLKVACLIVVLLCSHQLAAQNLVINPDFDTDVVGWSPFYDIDFIWDPVDYQGDPSSGCGFAASTDAPVTNSGIVQCVEPIVAGESYKLSAWLDISPSQEGDGSVGLFVWWRDGAGCTGTQTHALATPYVGSTAGWEQLTAAPEVAPAGTVSATLYLNIVKSSPLGDDYYVSFDGIDLHPAVSLFSDGFESSDTSAWTVTVP